MQKRQPCEDDFETIKLISNGAYGYVISNGAYGYVSLVQSCSELQEHMPVMLHNASCQRCPYLYLYLYLWDGSR